MIIKYRLQNENKDFEEFNSFSSFFDDALIELAEYLENINFKIYEIKKGKTGKKIYLYRLRVCEVTDYCGEAKKVLGG